MPPSEMGEKSGSRPKSYGARDLFPHGMMSPTRRPRTEHVKIHGDETNGAWDTLHDDITIYCVEKHDDLTFQISK